MNAKSHSYHPQLYLLVCWRFHCFTAVFTPPFDFRACPTEPKIVLSTGARGHHINTKKSFLYVLQIMNGFVSNKRILFTASFRRANRCTGICRKLRKWVVALEERYDLLLRNESIYGFDAQPTDSFDASLSNAWIEMVATCAALLLHVTSDTSLHVRNYYNMRRFGRDGGVSKLSF